MDNKIQVLELCNSDKDYQLKLLTNMVIKQDEKIRELESRLDAVVSREMKPNVYIEGLVESLDENREKLLDVVKAFFKEKMQIEQDIPLQDAYRRGKKEFMTEWW